MTTTELIELLKKYERGGATGRPREVMFEIGNRIIDTDGIDVTGSGDGLVTELYLSLPSAQPEPRWIPCEERLPENGHYYLWCSDMGSVQSDYYWNGFENGMKYGYNIVAWMPLPKPYKEDSDG